MGMARQSELLAKPLPSASVPVLITRPEAEARSFAKALITRMGNRLQPVIAPLIAPRYLMAPVPRRDYAAVVFTSAHGVEGARRLGVDLPRLAWCVGRKTAAAASAAGFQARAADGDADALVSAILADPPKGAILYLRGVDTSGNILERLTSAGVLVDTIIVYVQEPQQMDPTAIALLRGDSDVIVPLFSARTATLFQAAMPSDTAARLRVAAISPAVAGALANLPCNALAVAHSPDSQGMLDAVESLLADFPMP
jgi:uroporphyrinogen-III synthase